MHLLFNLFRFQDIQKDIYLYFNRIRNCKVYNGHISKYNYFGYTEMVSAVVLDGLWCFIAQGNDRYIVELVIKKGLSLYL